MPHPPASLPERAMPGRSFRLRARVVAGLFCAVCFAGLAARLAWLQLAGADGYAQRALGQQLRDTAVPAGRGLILSADGVVLATNASCWTIRACPREMPEARLELAAQGLGDILELDPARLLEQFRQRSSNDCLLRRRVDQDTAGAVRDFCQQNDIAGIRILQDTGGSTRRGRSWRRCWVSPTWTMWAPPGWSWNTTTPSPARTAGC